MFSLHRVCLPVAPHLVASGWQVLDLNAKRGSIHWLIGPAGSGKTALLETLALIRPLRGVPAPDRKEPIEENTEEKPCLHLLGHRITPDSPESECALIRRHISLINAIPLLREDWTVFNNVALPLQIKGLRQADIIRETSSILHWMNLQDYSGQSIRHLSLSLQQRIVMARSLVMRPSLFLADLTFMEPEMRSRLLSAIKAMASNGCTVILATQNQEIQQELPAPCIALPRSSRHTHHDTA